MLQYSNVCQHFQQSTDQLSMVVNLARCQLINRENVFSFPGSRLRMWPREAGSAVPSRVSPLILQTKAESGAYSRDSSCFARRRPYISSTAIVSVPSLSGHHAIAYQWRSLPRGRQHKASSPQRYPRNGCCLFRWPYQPTVVRLYFPKFPFINTIGTQLRDPIIGGLIGWR